MLSVCEVNNGLDEGAKEKTAHFDVFYVISFLVCINFRYVFWIPYVQNVCYMDDF